jgi:hypothetical protein
MKFKVLKTFKASLDGFNLADFNNEEILEENDSRLTEHFLTWVSDNKGFIEEIKEEKMLLKFENKAIFSAPENKEEEIKINNKKKGKK